MFDIHRSGVKDLPKIVMVNCLPENLKSVTLRKKTFSTIQVFLILNTFKEGVFSGF